MVDKIIGWLSRKLALRRRIIGYHVVAHELEGATKYLLGQISKAEYLRWPSATEAIPLYGDPEPRKYPECVL